MRRTRIVAGCLGATVLLSTAGAGPFEDPPGASRPFRSHRTLIFSDEFHGRAGQRPSSSKWTYDVGGGGWGNRELEKYTHARRNAHLDGHGNLVIAAHRGGRGGPRYTSARLKTQHRFHFKYGEVTARMRVPAGQGLWPAFWMLGSAIDHVGYPKCGEIDVMELLGQDPRVVYGTVHGPGPDLDVGIGGRRKVRHSLASGFHVYGAHWTPHQVRFTLDGHAYFTAQRSAYPHRDTWALDQPMFMILNLAVGGEWPGRPDSSTRFPGRLVVDWVRVRSGHDATPAKKQLKLA